MQTQLAPQYQGTADGQEAAVHAFAQDGFGFLAVGRALVLGSKLGLHGGVS